MLADRIRMCVFESKKLINRTTPTLVINQPYSTEGNGGRKLVRLENGWLVAGVKNTINTTIFFYVSKDSGNSFSRLCFQQFSSTGGSLKDFSMVEVGNKVYVIAIDSQKGVCSLIINAETQSNAMIYPFELIPVIETQTSYDECSLTKAGTELHACWSSKNSTYPNSFNIRYCKGVINGDGSVTWGSVEQITQHNNTNNNFKNPSIVLNNNYVHIIAECPIATSGSYIIDFTNNPSASNVIGSINSAWRSAQIHRESAAYVQSSPSACVDKDGVIHVAWYGADVTQAKTQIRYSKSLDGGQTWITPKVIVPISSTGNNETLYPSICVNASGEVFVWFCVRTDGWIEGRKSLDGGETWQRQTVGYFAVNGLSMPSCLDDNSLKFEEALMVFMASGVHSTNPNSVLFRGKWYE